MPINDDFSDTTSGASSLTLGSTVSGSIGIVNDVDYFKVDLAQGQRYLFSMDATGDGGLAYGGLGLQKPNGDWATGTGDYRVATFSYVAAEAGTYFLKARGVSENTGTYRIFVNDAEIVGNTENNNLTGTSFADLLLGLGGNDKLYGRAGNDFLDGGAGNDSLYGGLGDDLYVVDSASDSVVEAKNEGTDEVLTGLASYKLGTYVENLTYTGTGNFTGKGNSADNVITGGVGNDLLYSDAGNDRVYGGEGKDIIYAGIGDDLLDGGLGDDLFYGGIGNDTIYGGEGKDIIYAGIGDDLLDGGLGDDLFYGDIGNDAIYGGEGKDVVYGGIGNDSIDGGAGDDRLVGGLGLDQMTGGQGADVFIFATVLETANTSSTCDVITDFVQGQDRIDLSSIDASSMIAANNAFVWLGTGGFGTSSSGGLRYQKYDNAGTANDYTLVIGDTDSDTASEFMVHLTGLYDLTASDFLL